MITVFQNNRHGYMCTNFLSKTHENGIVLLCCQIQPHSQPDNWKLWKCFKFRFVGGIDLDNICYIKMQQEL